MAVSTLDQNCFVPTAMSPPLTTPLPPISESGSPVDAISDVAAASTPIRTAIVALLDLGANSIRFATSLTLATVLAAALASGLFLAAHQFKQAAQSARHAVRNARSPQALAHRLRATSHQPRTAPLQQLRLELDAASRKLELPTPKDQRATTSN